MASLTVTAAQVAAIYPEEADIFTGICAETIAEGDALYLASTGKYGLAVSNVSTKNQFRGIALEKGAAGQAISILRRGHIYGYTLTQAYDAQIFLGSTAGKLDGTIVAVQVPVGRVVALPDNSLTKVLFIHADWLRNWISS